MTAQTPDLYSGNLRPENPSANSDEIDLRRYLLILAKWWREILVISILAGAIAAVAITILNNSRIPLYSASADLLIVRLTSNVELDARVSTSVGASQSDSSGWRTSLLQLVNNSVVANAVVAELGEELPEGLRSPDAVLSVISAQIPLSADERASSNLIRISAETIDPETSAKIANSWAKHLVDYINGLYGEVPETMIESVTAERDQSLSTYQATEKVYEEFVATNQIDLLERQIQEKTTLRNELMLNYSRMLTTAIGAEYEARLNLYTTLASAPVEHAAEIVAARSAENVQSLTLLYNLRATTTTQLDHAQNMERTLVDGGEAAAKSNVASLQMLKLSTFTSIMGNERLPGNLLLSNEAPTIEMSLEEQLTDVRALIAVLEDYLTQLDADIEEIAEVQMAGGDFATVSALEEEAGLEPEMAATATYSNATAAYAHLLIPSGILEGSPASIDSAIGNAHETLLTQLEGEIQSLRAALNAERATEQQLTHQRNLAWTTYEAVGNKLQELNLLRSSANSEVRLGNPALVPLSPEPQISPMLPVLGLTLVGFFFAILLALLVDSLGGGPFFARRPT